MITDRINFRQPKYVLPAILYPLLLVTGYLVMDIFDTEVAEMPSALQTTEFLNPELPEAQMRDDGIGGKYESMVKSYGRIQDYSAVENIERNNNETAKEDYDSRYTDEDLALLDSEAAARSEELERLREMQEQLRQSAERGQAMVADSAGVQPLSEEERIARSEQRRKEALAELDKALAEARKQGQKGLQDVDSTGTESLAPTGSAVVGGKVEHERIARKDVRHRGGRDRRYEQRHHRGHGHVEHKHLQSEHQPGYGSLEDASHRPGRPAANQQHEGFLVHLEEFPQVGTDGRAGQHNRGFGPHRPAKADGDAAAYQRTPHIVQFQDALPLRNGGQDARHPVADVVLHDVTHEQRRNGNAHNRIKQIPIIHLVAVEAHGCVCACWMTWR